METFTVEKVGEVETNMLQGEDKTSNLELATNNTREEEVDEKIWAFYNRSTYIYMSFYNRFWDNLIRIYMMTYLLELRLRGKNYVSSKHRLSKIQILRHLKLLPRNKIVGIFLRVKESNFSYVWILVWLHFDFFFVWM